MKIHHPTPSKNAPFFPGLAIRDETHPGGCNALTVRGRRGILALGVALIVLGFMTGSLISARAADSVSDHISKAANNAGEAVKDAGESARNGLEKFWNRIDERRIKNRTPDQIVAWVIMGLLVGGLIQRVSKLNWFATLLLGLTGAFIGGIAENLIHLDFGMGAVLISYEELLASLAGGVLLIIIARMLASRKESKK